MRTNKAVCWSFALIIFLLFAVTCQRDFVSTETARVKTPSVELSPTVMQVVEAGLEQTKYTFYYDQSYSRISYPGGDVPLERGAKVENVLFAWRINGHYRYF